MKKALNLFLVVVCLVILAGCEKKNNTTPDANDANSTTTQTR